MSARKKAAPQKSLAHAVEIQLTKRALSDLREIDRHSAREWGRKTADKYLEGIDEALNRLRVSPNLLRLEPDLIPGLYFYRVQKHFLVCDFRDKTVNVLTVIHTSMDLPARLMELEPCLIAEAQILQGRLP